LLCGIIYRFSGLFHFWFLSVFKPLLYQISATWQDLFFVGSLPVSPIADKPLL